MSAEDNGGACPGWLADATVLEARRVPYLWGGGDPWPWRPPYGGRSAVLLAADKGLDCSGLIGAMFALAAFEGRITSWDWRDRGAVNRPAPEYRSAGGWLWVSDNIPADSVRPGDLIGMRTRGVVRRHVGMIVGTRKVEGLSRPLYVESAGSSRALPPGERWPGVRLRTVGTADDVFYARPRRSALTYSDGRPQSE